MGVMRLWARAGRGHGVGTPRVAAFAAGWIALAVALVSPLDALGTGLFSAHMVQHEVLMIVAAPLLVLGHPLAVWAWGLPFEQRRDIGRFFRSRTWKLPWGLVTDPCVAWLLHAVALWLWHIPMLFDAALASEPLHILWPRLKGSAAMRKSC
jgi:putative membrane protein